MGAFIRTKEHVTELSSQLEAETTKACLYLPEICLVESGVSGDTSQSDCILRTM